MEQAAEKAEQKPFKLNYGRTFLIGFAFFGILLLWQVYDSWCPTFLTELFSNAIYGSAAEATDQQKEQVQYLVGIMMALDNLAALILLPIFGHLSDKTHTKIGKRMPYILVGTFVCAIAFPFIPVFFHYNNLAGTVAMMAIVICFAMMYRNPAVALMPDVTPKPLRSRANAIINVMGYLGGAAATVVGMFFVLSQYLGTEKGKEHTWAYHNLWAIEAPFLIASVLMVVSALVLFFTVKENKVEKEMAPEMARGELVSETVDKVDDDAPMSKANKTMLWLILIAEFFWFMADNGIGTFMGNYTIYYLKCSSRSNMINTIVGGVGSMIGFILGAWVASKIGRKKTIWSGLGITIVGYVVWAVLTFATPVAGSGNFPWWIWLVWFIKGIGMSFVHVNSYPMVVELCTGKKIGAFTGYYYTASMAAQTITPIALGSLLLAPDIDYGYLPVYALCCLVISFTVFAFVKSTKRPIQQEQGLNALGGDD